MFIYLLLLFLICVGWFQASANTTKERKWLLFLIAFMCILCAFRGLQCGTDNINYQRIYESKINSREFEVLFGLSMDIIPNFRLWMISYAIITYGLLYFILKKEVKYCCLAVLIFVISPSRFFPETFNIVRQAIAAVIILYGFVLWKDQKYLYSVIAIAIASLFHTSSLVALPFLLLSRVTINAKISWIIIGATVVLGFAGSYSSIIRNFVLAESFFSNTGIDSLDVVTEHYTHYGTKENTLNVIGIGMRLLPTSIMCLLCVPTSDKQKAEYGFYYNVFLISTAINNLIIPSMSWGIRFMFSIQLIQVLAFPLAYQYANGNRRLLFKGVVVLLLLLFLNYLISLPTVGVRPIVPYEFSLKS